MHHELNPEYSGASAASVTSLQQRIEGTAATNSQQSLKFYSGNQSKTGVADIALRLGYAFIEKEEYRFAVNVAVVAPTGGKPTSTFVFAPVIGDNNAWALGAGITLAGKFCKKNEHEFRGVVELNYRYRFANTQERTLGLKGVNGSQFAVLYRGTTAVNASDLLTTDLKVTAGSAVNLLAGLGYDYKGFSADVSYELNGWERETAELASSSDFKEDATVEFASASSTPVYANPANAGVVTLTKANLDYAPATNPSKINHKIAGALGCTAWRDQKYPVALGLGGSYTFGSNRSAFQGWGVFGKVGVSF